MATDFQRHPMELLQRRGLDAERCHGRLLQVLEGPVLVPDLLPGRAAHRGRLQVGHQLDQPIGSDHAHGRCQRPLVSHDERRGGEQARAIHLLVALVGVELGIGEVGQGR